MRWLLTGILGLALAGCGPGQPAQGSSGGDGEPGRPRSLANQAPTGSASNAKGAPVTLPSGGSESWPEPNLELALLDLVRGFTPPNPEVTSDIRNAWQDRRRSLLVSLRSAPDELGRALLEHLIEHPEEGALLRDGLLTGAAYAAPQLAEPLLLEALQDYRGGKLQADLGLRGHCAELLAEIAPGKAEPVLREVLGDGIPTATWPREETLLGAYLLATQQTGSDAVPLLTTVATDIRIEAAARNLAVKELGQRCTPLALQAIRTVLTESNGDRYLRRLAAQSLTSCLAPAEAAAEIEAVLAQEADLGMQTFFSSLLDTLGAKLRSQGR